MTVRATRLWLGRFAKSCGQNTTFCGSIGVINGHRSVYSTKNELDGEAGDVRNGSAHGKEAHLRQEFLERRLSIATGAKHYKRRHLAPMPSKIKQFQNQSFVLRVGLVCLSRFFNGEGYLLWSWKRKEHDLQERPFI
jgi:hypothetical protein